MSVVDDLLNLETRVARRMKELRPMVDEYRELEQVAQRLGIADGATTAGQASTGRRERASGGAAGSASKRARTGGAKPGRSRASGSGNGRQAQVAGLVKQRPGITVRELGAELGVDPTSLYRVVHRLEQDGTIKKQGRQLQPV
jgi:MarR family protein